jgi:hypothetical protein
MRQIVPPGAARVAAERMRRLALVAMPLVALASISVALAGGSTLAGRYKTTLTSPPEAKGTWVLIFAEPSSSQTHGQLQRGRYTVIAFGHTFVRGTYATTGSRITFGHETGEGACAKPGTYTWKKAGKTLKFVRVSDAPICSGRSGVLAQPFTQER